MTRFSKFLLFIVILAAVVLPMMIKGPNGKPIMSYSDWLPDNSDLSGAVGKVKSLGASLESSAQQAVNSVTGDKNATVAAPAQTQANTIPELGHNQMYKWKDKHGNWQFSNQPPTDGSVVQVDTLPNVKNVMDAPVAKRKNSSSIGLPDGLSLDNAGQLLKKMGVSADQQQEKR